MPERLERRPGPAHLGFGRRLTQHGRRHAEDVARCWREVKYGCPLDDGVVDVHARELRWAVENEGAMLL